MHKTIVGLRLFAENNGIVLVCKGTSSRCVPCFRMLKEIANFHEASVNIVSSPWFLMLKTANVYFLPFMTCCCFIGYRLFRATMVATGFVFGSEIVYFVCVEENIFPLGGKIGLSVGAGLLCGLTAVLVHYVGYFVAGFQFGLLSAIAGLILLEQGYHPFTKWIPFGVIFGAGILAAFGVSTVNCRNTSNLHLQVV